MKRIAIFLPNWIGDVVMATPAIRAIRRSYPQSELISVAKSYVAETLAGSSWFQKSLQYDRSRLSGFWTLLKELREVAPDAAVLFPNSFRPALLAKLAGARTIVGFARYGRDGLLTKRLYPRRNHLGQPKPTPIIDDYNRVAELLGVDRVDHAMELFTRPVDDHAAEAIWKDYQLHTADEVFGLNPGGAFGSSKHWAKESFAQLAQRLADRPNAAVLVLCGPAERESARAIAQLAQRQRVVSLDQYPLSLGFTKAVIKRLTCLITTDSGPRHFASAFQRPVVTLFGPTHIAWTETYDPRARHLQLTVPCGPCQLRVCPTDHRCMTGLTPMMVYQAVDRLLKDLRQSQAHLPNTASGTTPCSSPD